MKAIKVHSIGDVPKVVNLFELRKGNHRPFFARYVETDFDGRKCHVSDSAGCMLFPYSHKLFNKLSALHIVARKLYTEQTLLRYKRGHGRTKSGKTF